MKLSRLIYALMSLGLATSHLSAKELPKRVVAIGGGVTETIYALGAEALLVGVDTSSTYPDAATKLPQCGYQRAISAEGVISLKPDFVLLAGTAGPESALKQLSDLGVATLRLSEDYRVDAAKERIEKIGDALGKKEEAAVLVAKIDAAVASLPAVTSTPKVLFVLSRGGGNLMASGKGTAADAMIALAGGVNAGAEFSGYKPISAESLVALAPEVILTTSRTFAELGEGGLGKALPGVELTPAGKGKRFVVMDDLYLLGFGPRIGEALVELSRQLHTPQEENDLVFRQ